MKFDGFPQSHNIKIFLLFKSSIKLQKSQLLKSFCIFLIIPGGGRHAGQLQGPLGRRQHREGQQRRARHQRVHGGLQGDSAHVQISLSVLSNFRIYFVIKGEVKKFLLNR